MRSTMMLVLMVVATLVTEVRAAEGVVGYYRFPTIHGDRIVFASEGDLWEVDVHGGAASRLTTHVGEEAFAKLSPDGKWLAFSAEYDGNVDAYVMPAGGGEPRRLTFHPDRDEVISWRPDSGSVVFRSRRGQAHGSEWRLYDVPVGGGAPMLIPVGMATLASFDDDNRFIAFNRISRERATWKRYKGGTAQDIWIGDLRRREFTRLTDFEGTDRFPMWHRGRVYYVSDESGRLNIHSARPDGSDSKQHTFHEEYDARWPDESGGRIVYMYAGGLRVYDIDADRDREITVTIRSDRAETRLGFQDASETLENYALNSDGSRLVIASRGELWTAPVEGGRTIMLTASSGVRERLPSFGPEDDRIAAVTDETGEQEVAIFDAWGEDDREVLTREDKGWIFDPVWSSDGKWIAYADLTLTLRLVEVETGTARVVHHADAWEIREYVFSPDGRYLAFTVPGSPWGDSDMSIHIYDVRSGRTHAVTTPFSGDYSPSWSSDGRYLFFLSRRVINPVFCERDFEHATINSAVPCALVLKKGDVSPFASREVLAMFGPEDEEAGDEGNESESRPAVTIDFDGLRERVVQFPVDAGVYESLRAYPGGVFYLSREVEGILDQTWGGADAGARFALHQFDLEAGEETVFVEPIRDYALSGDGEMVAFRMDRAIHVVSSAAPPEDPSDPESPGGVVDPADLRLQVLPVAEWRQIFEETWRLQRDFYWATDMAGVDWAAVREQYARLLPRVGTRRELNDLIGEMIGELSTSHTYVWGGATRDADSIAVGMLGADLVPDVRTDRLRFAKVLRPEVWETHVHAPLAQPHTRVERGEYLISVNGRDVDGQANIHALLANLAGEEVVLEVGREADGSDAREIQVETIGMDRSLRYLDWRRRNREYVDKASQGRIGYLHLPDMDAGGLVAFVTAFYAQLDREGLVIDIRYNGGGFISSMLIERLAREMWAYDISRWGGSTTYPSQTHPGHKVVLINYFAGSDGDIFPESFRIRGLGPLIGTRTWGGVNGIRADKAYIDGGMVTQPEFAWWEPRRGWGLENGGVAPDIEVDILPADSAVDHDAQLERALEELNRMLADAPVRLPEPPPYPDKSIDAMRSGNWE